MPTGVLCELCDDAQATVYCPTCSLNQCRENECDQEMHRGALSKHTRKELEVTPAVETKVSLQPGSGETTGGEGNSKSSVTNANTVKDCDFCLASVAMVSCKECKMVYCAQCDEDCHVGSLKRHLREAVKVSVSDPEKSGMAGGVTNANTTQKTENSAVNNGTGVKLEANLGNQTTTSMLSKTSSMPILEVDLPGEIQRRKSVIMARRSSAASLSSQKAEESKQGNNNGVQEKVVERVLVKEIIQAPTLPHAPALPTGAAAHAFVTTADGVQMYVPKDYSFVSKNGIICAFPEGKVGNKESQSGILSEMFRMSDGGYQSQQSQQQNQQTLLLQQQITMLQQQLQNQQTDSVLNSNPQAFSTNKYPASSRLDNVFSAAPVTVAATTTPITSTPKESMTALYRELKTLELRGNFDKGKFIRRRIASIQNMYQSTSVVLRECQSVQNEGLAVLSRAQVQSIRERQESEEQHLRGCRKQLLHTGEALAHQYRVGMDISDQQADVLRVDLFDVETSQHGVKDACREIQEEAKMGKEYLDLGDRAGYSASQFDKNFATTLPSKGRQGTTDRFEQPDMVYNMNNVMNPVMNPAALRATTLTQQREARKMQAGKGKNHGNHRNHRNHDSKYTQSHHPVLHRYKVNNTKTHDHDSDEELDLNVDVQAGYEWLREDEVVRS